MKAIDCFIFDLDGTLIDATDDVATAVNKTLARYHLPALPRETIAAQVGHGVRELLRGTFGTANGNVFEDALHFMLATYYDHCLDSTKLYPTVADTLTRMHEAGKQLYVCTNKSLRPSEKILSGLNIRNLFRSVVGGDSFAHRKPHPIGVQHIVALSGAAPERTLMVGDSAVDVLAGKRAGVRTCACSWGLRPLAELHEAGPERVIDRLDALLHDFC